jgi:hypothetical protein
MFPSAKVSTVTSESAGVKRTLTTPSKVTLRHYSVVPSLAANISRYNLIVGRPRPEPHVHVTLDSSTQVLGIFPLPYDCSAYLTWAPTVTTETRICLGMLSVTLTNVFLVKVTGEDNNREQCDVHFGFEERNGEA